MSHQSPERQASSAKSTSTSASPARRTRASSSPREVLQRAQVDPGSLTPADVLQLQRTVGNRATGRLLAQQLTVQTKLQLGPANDKYEQEADDVAHQVVRRMAAPPVQRKEESGEQTQAWPRYDTSAYTTTPASQPVSVKRTFVAPQVQREDDNGKALPPVPASQLENENISTNNGKTIQRVLSDTLLSGLHKQRRAVTGMSEEDALEEEGGAGKMLKDREPGRIRDELLRGLHKQRRSAMGMSEEDALEEEGNTGKMLEEQQASDPNYQQALSGFRESTVNNGMPKTRSDRRHRQVWNRRERQLGPVLKEQRERQFFESRIAERNKGLSEVGTESSISDRAKILESAQAGDRQAQEERRLADEEAKPLVEERMAGIDERSHVVLKNKFKRVNTDVLDGLVSRKKWLLKDKKWSALNEILTEINDESAKIKSYENALVTAQERIMALSKAGVSRKITFALRNTQYAAFDTQVKMRERNDVTAAAALTTLENALQTQEDKIANDQLAATERRRLRDNGLWPANNRTAAQIVEKTRANVGGSVEERAAVIEALDAYKNGTDHSWARKWGAYHGNGEGNLPGAGAGLGGYTEYYVRPNGAQVGQIGLRPAGTRRLVISDKTGFVYYSDNHYGAPNGTNLPAFVKITDA